jgi:hypothetical protein
MERINEYNLPEQYFRDSGLMHSLNKFVRNIYKHVDESVNPYYKVIELLERDQQEHCMSYFDLETLEEYYSLPIIEYLTQDGCSNYYLGYSCFNAAELKRALKPKYNQTDGRTLRDLLANMY